MIILDEEWHPGGRGQAIGRIERIGQEKPMTVHTIHMKKTIDDWMHGIMQFKEGVVGEFEEGMPTPTYDDLRKALEDGEI
jgi:SNF2 family DNA or RNA helicase